MLFLILTADETDKVKALFHKYSGKLLSHIKKIVKDEDLADDALQETFIRVMKNIDKIEDANPGKTKNYLYTIANNSALHFYNQIKKYNTCHKTLDEKIIISIDDMDVAESIAKNIISERIDECIDEMTENDREIILLKYGCEYDDAHIASLLGITDAAARQRLSRARKRLAAILERTKEG